MTVRTKSKSQQWTVWLCAALALLAVYVVLSRFLYGSSGADVLVPRQHRLMLPLLALLVYIAKETRWDGIRREEGRGQRKQGGEKVKAEGQEGSGEEKVGGEKRWRAEEKPDSTEQPTEDGRAHAPSAPQSSNNAVSFGNDCGGPGVSALPRQNESDAKRHVHSPTPAQNSNSVADASATGEELFDQARAVPHQVVPDFEEDGPYLELLGASAAKGYAPALAKLGEYAMRRAAWVEAYYWMKQAQRNGMHGLSPTLREIRKNWSLDDFPDQSSNVNQLFTLEAGSVGRALLHIDSRHEAASAREFLKAAHPEYLV